MAVVSGDRPRPGLRESRRVGDSVFHGVALFFAVVVVLAAASLVISLIAQAWPALTHIGVGQLLGSSTWNPNQDVGATYGALAFIYGTFVTSLIALLFAGIVGIMVAMFLVELAPPLIARPVSFLIEMLAAVPSIIFGLFGLLFVIPLITPLELNLNTHLGFIPFFGGSFSSRNLFTAALVLTMMILPTVAALSRDVMAAVPGSQREGMLALGATRWEVVRNVVIPYARAGIIGALILALGRAVGETLAVTMVIGNTARITPGIFSGGYTLAAVLANESGDAFSKPLYIGALFELGLLLLLISVLLNTLARILVWRVSRGAGTVR